ncbi:MAG: hypothetical protein HQ522_16175 [Bacteroidetes bacterium]|nr:hypothetical protein [Bacteroidota bacterium]
MQNSIYQGLEFTTEKINLEFKIKVNGVNYSGQKMNILVGVSGLINLIGIELANTLFHRAFKSKGDVCICMLRRGLSVKFYRH